MYGTEQVNGISELKGTFQDDLISTIKYHCAGEKEPSAETSMSNMFQKDGPLSVQTRGYHSITKFFNFLEQNSLHVLE